jgi:hypothetical protein
MTRRKRIATATGLVLAGFALVVPAVLAVPGTGATVRFGNDDVGSSFPPITEHDNSGNGKFNLIPRTVTIAAGGSVTYDILIRFGIHQPAVYEAGTKPGDIVPEGPFPFVNDTTGRIVGGLGDAVAAPAPGVSATGTWTTPALTEPGRYLVLCNFAPHFTEFDMYGWINVK